MFDVLTYVKSIDSSRERRRKTFGLDKNMNNPNSVFESSDNIESKLLNSLMHGGYGGGSCGTASGNNIVQAAASEVGIGSDANSGERYGESGPWCAAFAVKMYENATGQSSTPIGDSHYVPNLVDNAKSKGLFADPSDPRGAQPGNFVFFGDDYHHVGIVESVDPDGTVHTIEGNSSDQVARRTYAADGGQISGYAMVAA